MGKASKFKKLRRLAKELPGINRKFVIGEKISGKELVSIEKDNAGNAIDSGKIYIKKSVIDVPLNHNRQMKKNYNKYGAAGVIGYMNEIKNFAAKNASNP